MNVINHTHTHTHTQRPTFWGRGSLFWYVVNIASFLLNVLGMKCQIYEIKEGNASFA